MWTIVNERVFPRSNYKVLLFVPTTKEFKALKFLRLTMHTFNSGVTSHKSILWSAKTVFKCARLINVLLPSKRSTVIDDTCTVHKYDLKNCIIPLKEQTSFSLLDILLTVLKACMYFKLSCRLSFVLVIQFLCLYDSDMRRWRKRRRERAIAWKLA